MKYEACLEKSVSVIIKKIMHAPSKFIYNVFFFHFCLIIMNLSTISIKIIIYEIIFKGGGMAHSMNKCVVQVNITVKFCDAKTDIKMYGIWIGPHSSLSHHCIWGRDVMVR